LILLDTSVLIESLTGSRESASALREVLAGDERIAVPTLVLYEWWRGPRTGEELDLQESLFPRKAAIPLGVQEAALAAQLYRQVQRPRGREIDLAIAACALCVEASLWTLNRRDFADIPKLRLW